jgi:hypothetical protein
VSFPCKPTRRKKARGNPANNGVLNHGKEKEQESIEESIKESIEESIEESPESHEEEKRP